MSMTVTIDNTIVTVEMATTGPQGPTGATGATGPTGPQGPKGDTGAAGVVQTVSGTSPITATGTTAITVGIDQSGLTLAQSQITNLTTDLAAKAPLASPTFTGDPKAPTPTSTDNDTSIATTAFVQAQKTSPALAGTPTAPTAAMGTSTTQLATTEFVDEATVDLRQFAADKSVLDNIPARIHPAEQLLKQAVFWIDANHSSASGQTVSNLGWGGSALNATCGSSGSADSNDPKFLSWDGTNYVYLPGVASNYLSVPDANSLDIVSDIEIRVQIALDTWTTPSSTQRLIAKRASGQYSYGLLVDTSGYLVLAWTEDGSTSKSASSTVVTGITNGAMKWVKATLDVDNGSSGRDIKFWTSDDGVTWVQLGSTVTQAGVTSIWAGTAALEIGADTTAGNYSAGKVFRAQVLNGINGTPVLDVDTSLIASGSATSFTALTGQTVTINRSTSGRKSVAVTSPCYLLGTDDYIEVNNRWIDGTAKSVYLPGVAGNYLSAPDSAALDVTGDIDIRVKAALDTWTPSADQILVAKWQTSGQFSYYFGVASATSGMLTFRYSGDGTASTIVNSSVVSGIAAGATKWVRVTRSSSTGDVKFFTSDDAVTWTQLGTTQTTAASTMFSGTSILEIGSRLAGTSLMAPGRFYRAIIYSDLTETTKVFDANMETSITSLTQTTFTESSTNAATVTINKSGTGYVSTPIVQSGYVYPTGTSNLTPATFSLLDFGATDSVTVVWTGRQWNTPPSNGRFIFKGDALGARWGLSNSGTSLQANGVFNDGTNSGVGASPTYSAGSLVSLVSVLSRASSNVTTYANGSAGTPVTASSVGASNSVNPLRIGVGSGTNTGNYNDVEFIAAAIFRRALTASEITTLSNYFTGRAA